MIATNLHALGSRLRVRETRPQRRGRGLLPTKPNGPLQLRLRFVEKAPPARDHRRTGPPRALVAPDWLAEGARAILIVAVILGGFLL